MFYRSLGKDAEGIAVLAFIELILKYDGADFANWPGLARCKVHFALFDAMQKQGQIWENEAQVDTDSAAGTELLESCRDADGSLDELARLLLSLDLQEALRQLNPAQLRCAQCHQAPLKGFGQAARAVIKIQKDCRLAVLFFRCFI